VAAAPLGKHGVTRVEWQALRGEGRNRPGGTFDSLGSTLVALAVMADHAVYFSDKFVLSQDALDTTRKAAWIGASLKKYPIPGVGLFSPRSATLAVETLSCEPSWDRVTLDQLRRV